MALTLGTNIPPFHAAQGNIFYTSALAVNLTGDLGTYAIAKTKIQVVKNLTVTPPKVAVEKVDLLGAETTATAAGTAILNSGTFQNAIWDMKSATSAKCTGTMVLTMLADGSTPHLPDLLDLATGTGQTIAATTASYRHTFGDSAANQIPLVTGGFFIVLNNGYTSGVIAFANPMVSWGDIKIGGGDGTYEVDFELESLAKDFAIEVKQNT